MKRLENGLNEGVEYFYDENKKINWMKMLLPEHVYINSSKKDFLVKKLNKPFEEIKVEEVNNTDLIITLQGIRYLLDLKGYKYCKTTLDIASPEYAAATCEICFLPDIDNPFEQVFSANASAHPNNTNGFMKQYLVEAASNRALCRAVRSYLKINIVSREELGGEIGLQEEETPKNSITNPESCLINLLKKKGKTFEDLKKKLVTSKKFPDVEKWNTIQDVPKVQIFNIVEFLNKG